MDDRPSLSARDYVESLHQNSRATLLYGKNNVLVQPVRVRPGPRSSTGGLAPCYREVPSGSMLLIHSFIHPPTHLFIHLPICPLSICSPYASISIYPFIRPHANVSCYRIHPCIHPSFNISSQPASHFSSSLCVHHPCSCVSYHPFIHVPVFICIHPSIHPFVHLFASPSVLLPVHSAICPFILSRYYSLIRQTFIQSLLSARCLG